MPRKVKAVLGMEREFMCFKDFSGGVPAKIIVNYFLWDYKLFLQFPKIDSILAIVVKKSYLEPTFINRTTGS